jgi:hypothetical protein
MDEPRKGPEGRDFAVPDEEISWQDIDVHGIPWQFEDEGD